jgi:hypothetical protein
MVLQQPGLSTKGSGWVFPGSLSTGGWQPVAICQSPHTVLSRAAAVSRVASSLKSSGQPVWQLVAETAAGMVLDAYTSDSKQACIRARHDMTLPMAAQVFWVQVELPTPKTRPLHGGMCSGCKLVWLPGNLGSQESYKMS